MSRATAEALGVELLMQEIKITINLTKNVCIRCCLTEWHLKRNDSTERGKLVVQYHLGTFVWSTHSCPALHSLMCLQVKCFHQLPQTKCLFFIPMMYWRKKNLSHQLPQKMFSSCHAKTTNSKSSFLVWSAGGLSAALGVSVGRRPPRCSQVRHRLKVHLRPIVTSVSNILYLWDPSPGCLAEVKNYVMIGDFNTANATFHGYENIFCSL